MPPFPDETEFTSSKSAFDSGDVCVFNTAISLWDVYSAFSLSPTTGKADINAYITAVAENASGVTGFMQQENSTTSTIDFSGKSTHARAEIAFNNSLDGSSYALYNALHEIGHALGLSHPASIASNSNYTTDMTVMSYNTTDHSVVTPMAYDIAALQKRYGSFNFNDGDTTYNASSLGVNGAGMTAQTIVDTGGAVDTIDLHSVSGSHIIDLRQAINSSGQWTNARTVVAANSPVTSLEGHEYIFIAQGSIIENAIGGAGNDKIVGNFSDNTLTGGMGVDYIDGGAGVDTAVYAGYYNDYQITTDGNGGYTVLDTNAADGDEAEDVLTHVERLKFSDGYFEYGVFKYASLQKPIADSDTAYTSVNGSVTINVLANDYDPDGTISTISLTTQAAHGTAAFSGNNFIYTPNAAYSGIDTFSYTITDNDNLSTQAWVTVGVGVSVINGTSGADAPLNGTSGNDIVQGLGGNDEIHAGAGNDYAYGGSGNDKFYGADGTEQYDGGSGSDSYIFNMATDTGWVGITERDSQGMDGIFLSNTISGDHIDFTYNSTTDQLNAFYYPSSVGGPGFSFSIIASKALNGTGVESINIDGRTYTTTNIINAAQYAGGTFKFDIADYEANGYPVLLADSSDPFQPVVDHGNGTVSVFAEWGSTSSTYDLLYADELFHALKVSASGDPNGVSSAPALGYIKELTLHAGINPDHVRLTVDNTDNASISIHLDDVDTTYQYYYFEDGYTITGYSFNSAGSGGVGSVIGSGGGSYTINGSNLAFDPETTDTYYFDTIRFDGGDSINLLGVLKFEGTDINETLYGIDRADIVYGYGGNDSIYSRDGDDSLNGGVGSDTLYGGVGDDSYNFAVGDGSDVISEYTSEGIDTVELTGYNAEDIRLWTDGYGYLHLENRNNTSDNITIYASTTGVGSIESTIGQYVEQVVFDDATLDLTGGLPIEGSDDADYLYGTQFDDILKGMGGADYFYGNRGNDTLIGGTEDDTLIGGVGGDTYVFTTGDGTDTISEYTSEGVDTIRLTEYSSADIRLWTDGYGYLHLENRNNTSDNITVYAGTTGMGTIESTIGQYVEQVVFDDLTVWDLTGALSIEGASGVDYLYGTQFSDTIQGMAGADYIYANRGNDILIGGIGNDTLIGGVGDDAYVFSAGDGADIISEYVSEGADTIRLTGYSTADIRLWTDSYGYLHLENRNSTSDNITVYAGTTGVGTIESTIGHYFERILFDDTTVWSLTGALNIEGSSGADYLYGTQFDDTVQGMTGNDYLYGNRGDDTLIGGTGDDALIGGVRNDTYSFSAGDGADTISEYVSEGTDTIRLTGYSTADIRLWTDSYGYLHLENRNNTSDNITVNAGTTGVGTIESTIGQYVERVVFDDTTVWSLAGGLSIEGSSSSDSLYGTAFNDTMRGMDGVDYLYGNRGDDLIQGGNGDDSIYGGDGNDTIEGGANDDTLNGEAGTDTVTYVNAGSAVTVNLATTTSQNTVGAGSDTLAGFENLIGSAYNDTLTGNGSANVIEGGAGNDIMNGGSGTDTASYSTAGSAVTVNLATTTSQNTGGAGSDTLTSFENLLGSAYNDTLTGNSSGNTIEGGNGNDTLDGAGGTDTVSYASASAAVTVSLAISSSQNTVCAGSDTLSNFENLTGSIFGDTLTGDGNANTISGGDGNDLIQGGAGNDIMYGGSGYDTVSYSDASAAITLSLAVTSSQNTGGAGSDTVSQIENIIGSAYNDTLTGGSSGNIIEGGLGDDILDGGSGVDTLSYRHASAAISVSLAVAAAQNTGGAGQDTVSNFENILGSDYNDTLTGNSSNNVIQGGAGDDILDGGSGVDTVSYEDATSGVSVNLTVTTAQNTVGAGIDTITGFERITGSAYNDTLTGGNSAETYDGGAGDDTLNAGGGNDYIIGGNGNDTILAGSGNDGLYGGEGNDFLSGQSGTDTLYGEAGSDIFAFEVASAFASQDTIADFSIAELDKIDISALLVGYNPTQSAIDDFVIFTTSGVNTIMAIDRDGSGSSYSSSNVATINNITGLDADDLLNHGQIIV